MRVLCACISATVVLVACDSPLRPQPTAPNAIGTPTAPSGASGTVGGLVTAVGNSPAGDAKVIVMGVDWPGNFVVESTAVTDANGRYSISSVPAAAMAVWHLVGTSKPGYFADFKWWMEFPKGAEFDLDLTPWVHISLGESFQGRIGDAECAGLGYGGWSGRAPCQRFALTVPRSGTLDLTVSAPVFNFDVDVVKPDGTFAGYAASSFSPVLVRIPVEAGLTYEIRVAAVGPARDFRMTTSLQ